MFLVSWIKKKGLLIDECLCLIFTEVTTVIFVFIFTIVAINTNVVITVIETRFRTHNSHALHAIRTASIWHQRQHAGCGVCCSPQHTPHNRQADSHSTAHRLTNSAELNQTPNSQNLTTHVLPITHTAKYCRAKTSVRGKTRT